MVAPKKAPAKVRGIDAFSDFEAAFAQRHGALSLRRADRDLRPRKMLSTGSLELDLAMGGGYVRGRISQIWGPEGVGKTSLMTIAAANAQRDEPEMRVGYVDMEHTLDYDYMEMLGVDRKQLYHVQPDNAESLADVVKDMAMARASKAKDAPPLFSVIVIDSVGNMTPQEEFEKDAADATVGTIAKIVTRMVRVNSVLCSQADIGLLVVNQVRAIIGPRGGTTTGGGMALRHVTTHTLKIGRTSADLKKTGSGDSSVQVGMEIAVKVEKNKISKPGRVVNLTLMNSPTERWGPAGINQLTEAFGVGKQTGVIETGGGGYYTLPDGQRVRGEAEVITALEQSPALVAQIRELAIRTIDGEVITDPLKEGTA